MQNLKKENKIDKQTKEGGRFFLEENQ